MGTHVQVEIEDDKYEQLRKLKDKHGVTWYGMLRSGALHLESCQQELSGDSVSLADD